MEEPKLIITPKKYIEESAVTSIRLPKDMLRDLDTVANYSGRTRNEIMLMCLEFALRNIKIDESREG